MSFVYLPERVADYLRANGCSDGELFATLKSNRMRLLALLRESRTDCSETLQFGMMRGRLTAQDGVDWWISLLRDSHASRFQLQEKGRELKTKEIFGPTLFESFARYDPNSSSWKTFQVSLLTRMLDEYSETWLRAGTIVDGVAYQQPKWEQTIREIGCGLWPTPKKQSANSPAEHGQGGQDLQTAVKMWPTPTKEDWRETDGETRPSRIATNRKTDYLNRMVMWRTPRANDWKGGVTGKQGSKRKECDYFLPDQVGGGGQLNPDWVEWLMGWPIGWTRLEPLPKEQLEEWIEKMDKDTWWEIDPADMESKERWPTPSKQDTNRSMEAYEKAYQKHGDVLQKSLQIEVQRRGKNVGLIPRIAKNIKHRVSRLKALGEGQVPEVVQVVWELLNESTRP